MSRQKVVIVGAGIGGLATANLLAKAGYEVAVYEQHEHAGGRVDTFSAEGFTFDMGPSWYLMTDVFEHYYELLGEDIHQHLTLERLDPAYKVFFEDDQPITITSKLAVDTKTFESIEQGAAKALERYVARSQRIYRLSLKHFLYTNFTSPRDFLKFEILASGPAMTRLALQSIHSYVRGFFKTQRLQQILEYPMVFLGTSPFKAPALYSLMSALDFKEGVFYPKGGLYEIIRSLEDIGRQLGVTYHYAAPVAHINAQSGKASGITLADGQHVTADIVIANADLQYVETVLLDTSVQSYPARYWDKQQAGPSALLLYLGVTGKLPNLVHHNLCFVDDWQQNFTDIYETRKLTNPASLYICKPSQTDTSVAPKEHENVFVLVPLPPGKILTNAEQEALAEQTIAQIADMTHTPDFASRITYRRVFGPQDFVTKFHAWQASALGPSHVLKQSAFWRTPNKSKKLSNLYYVGASTTPGIGLPMCLIGAELVYKRLAHDTRGGAVKTVKTIGVSR